MMAEAVLPSSGNLWVAGIGSSSAWTVEPVISLTRARGAVEVLIHSSMYRAFTLHSSYVNDVQNPACLQVLNLISLKGPGGTSVGSRNSGKTRNTKYAETLFFRESCLHEQCWVQVKLSDIGQSLSWENGYRTSAYKPSDLDYWMMCVVD